MRTYQCPDCEQTFDFLHMSRDEPPPSECSVCGADLSEGVDAELPKVSIGSDRVKAMEKVSQDYMKAAKLTDMQDNLREGDLAVKVPDNPVTQVMGQWEGAGWQAPQVDPRLYAGTNKAAHNVMGNIQSRHVGPRPQLVRE